MKKIYILTSLLIGIVLIGTAQRVRGTIKKGPAGNEIIVTIKPTQAFTALMSNLAVSVQIPKTVGARPDIVVTNLQSSLFSTWTPLNVDQGDAFYTWGFNCVAPGASNTDATNWTTNEIDVLKIAFMGTGGPVDARLCHYLDGGSAPAGAFAIFYVETSLAAVNGGVLSDWGALFYGTGASNGTVADGSIGVPNANYSFVPISDVVLPVNFLSFYAIKSGDDAKLNWTVENDINNSYFEIERSLDGRTYSKIAKVSAMNNGRSSNTYEAADPRLSGLGSAGIYYRIKQVDNNGTVIYSPVRNLNLTLSLDAVNLYPNPAKTVTKLVWDVQMPGKGTVTIRDAVGRQVQTISMELVKGINQKDLNVSALPSGEYNVTVIGSNTQQTIKLSKIN